MLEYEWGTQSTVMLSGDDNGGDSSSSDHNRHNNQFYDNHYFTDPTQFVNPSTFTHPTSSTPINFHIPEPHYSSFFDPRAHFGASAYAPLSLDPDPTQYMVVPKAEPVPDFASRIGLNLGGRTYFSSTESEFVNRLYRRSRLAEAGFSSAPRCQAEGCNVDLTHAKHYHRRHKVCEFHSKAAAVVAGGLTQRFCQQCSRFHLLTEFDNGKRSCRKRLADHNRRRRKSNQANTNQEQQQTPKSQNTGSPSDNLTRSPQDSGAQSTSSVTVAISPPRIPLDYFQQRSY